MDVQRGNGNVGPSGDSKDVHHGADEGFDVAVSVARNSLQILLERNIRDADGMKTGRVRVAFRRLVINFDQAREHGGEQVDTILSEIVGLGNFEGHLNKINK